MSTIELVFEGQHVTPAALDARWVAAVISAYAESLGAIGMVETGGDTDPFVLALASIRPGSARYQLARIPRPNDPPDADEQLAYAAERLPVYLGRSASMPRPVARPIENLRKAIRALPAHVSVIAARAEHAWALTDRLSQPSAPEARSMEVLRGKVLRAGGTKPRIQLLIDEKIVSFDATTSLAQEAGTHLYSEVEVDVDLVREARPPMNPIVSGRVTRLVPVEDVDPVEAWDRWYEAAGRPWSKVADIEGELGRDG